MTRKIGERVVVRVKIDSDLEKYRPYKNGDVLLCLGEIQNMPNHYIFVNTYGTVHWGFHSDEFEIIDEEQIVS